MKVDYETLSKINPKLIYASASGFGEKGPDAGGGALNVGLVKALEDVLKKKLIVPEQPQFVTALGAALFAKEAVEKAGGYL